MTTYVCDICYVYQYKATHGDKGTNIQPGTHPKDFPNDWECPFCGSNADHLMPEEAETPIKAEDLPHFAEYLAKWTRQKDELEKDMETIHSMAIHAESVFSSMRTKLDATSWDSLLFLGAQMATLPLNEDEEVSLMTVIGPKSKRPLELSMPVFVSHMSFGALSKEAKLSLARGSAKVGTAIGSGEGGVLKEELDTAGRYIFEYVPNRYSYNIEDMKRVDAIEVKIGQSTKPGMGGHLPGEKVTAEIAELRGFPIQTDIISPARFPDIDGVDGFRELIDELRSAGNGVPVGLKIAAGHIEKDLDMVMEAGADFVTIDGRPGGTGSTLNYVKDSTSIPTVIALDRARRHIDDAGSDLTLVITGGLRSSADVAKALAMGADAVALGTACLMAIGCQQYRLCNTGKCPTGVTTQNPELRLRLVADYSAKRLANFLNTMASELKDFSRLTGRSDVHDLSCDDLVCTDLNLSRSMSIRHMDGRYHYQRD